MRLFRVEKAIKILFFVAVVATVLGFAVKGLWNVLMPQIFGWPRLTFWQALGLLVLTKLLFGGFHRHAGPPRWKNRVQQRLEQMSPEERERFRQGMRCGGRRPINHPVEP